MKKLVVGFVMAALVVSLPSGSFAQCGDVNNSGGSPGIPDLTYLLGYLVGSGPAPPDSTKADMDDRSGITISDLFRLLDWIFFANPPLDCSIDKQYHYACALSDTVCVPFKKGIGDAVTEVLLPVIATWSNSTRGYYLPFEPHGAGSNSAFTYVETIVKKSDIQFYSAGDTVYFLAGYPSNVSPGLDTLGHFRYTRVSSGIGTIVARAIDRSPVLRLAVEKGDSQLYRPITIYKYPAGDLNCDTEVDIADLTYIVAWMFGGGPAPCDPYGGP